MRGVHDATLLVLRPSGEWVVVRAPELLRPVGVAASSDTLLEVIDGDASRLLVLTLEGRIVRNTAVAAPFQVDQAQRTADGWALVGTDAEGGMVLAWADAAGSVGPAVRLPVPDSVPVDAHFTPRGATVLVGLAGAPHTVWHAAPGEPVREAGFATPDLAGAVARAAGVEPLWVSVGLVPVGEGFLRTFSDLRSDHRLFVLYDADGAILRQTMVDSPVGVIGAVPGQEVLVGVRRVERPELVLYGWRWRTER
ncbi:MAG TPA: hypothetical protein VFQ45_22915 [Longimicrobium sp.]|nr:hypothetical protein [Longimicrobium sp.]